MFFSGYKFYSVGYADPLMAAALGCTIALFIDYYRNKSSNLTLFIMAICAITACWSKQPALLFAGISLPIIGLIELTHHNLKKSELLAIIIIALSAYVWAFGPGAGFYNNSGVIDASLHASLNWTSIISAFLKGFYRYFICQPLVLVLFILAGVCTFKNRQTKFLFIFFIIPSTLLWLTFAKYDMREGLHITIICGVLIASENFLLSLQLYLPEWYKNLEAYAAKYHRYIAIILLIIGFLIASLFSFLIIKRSDFKIFPLDANKTIAYKYFPSIGEYIYQIMQNKKLIILTPTHYEAGMFYGRNIIVQNFPYNTVLLKNIILTNKINYVVLSSKVDPDAAITIQLLQKKYPELLQEVFISKPHIHYQLFCVNPFTNCQYRGG